jgi:hypothetical protein
MIPDTRKYEDLLFSSAWKSNQTAIGWKIERIKNLVTACQGYYTSTLHFLVKKNCQIIKLGLLRN